MDPDSVPLLVASDDPALTVLYATLILGFGLASRVQRLSNMLTRFKPLIVLVDAAGATGNEALSSWRALAPNAKFGTVIDADRMEAEGGKWDFALSRSEPPQQTVRHLTKMFPELLRHGRPAR